DLFVNTRALPRAFVVAGVQVVPDHPAAFDAIHATGFDPTRTVVLEQGDAGGGLPLADRAPAAASEPGGATITGYGPNEIKLDVAAANDGVLFLSEVYYPGWRAWVDDREVPVLRADFLFRGIQVPAGAHQVRLQYDPPSFKVGVGLFALTLLGLAGWGVWGWRRARL
ncbi:MAG: YfhO family protein, partial [Chloroflexi bacterium]|nr:YfhO family protein [Chloroflexota bacterium]